MVLTPYLPKAVSRGRFPLMSSKSVSGMSRRYCRSGFSGRWTSNIVVSFSPFPIESLTVSPRESPIAHSSAWAVTGFDHTILIWGRRSAMPVGTKARTAGAIVSGERIPLKRTVSTNGPFFARTNDPGILYMNRYGVRLVVSVNFTKKFGEFPARTHSLHDGAFDFASSPSMRHSGKKDAAAVSPLCVHEPIRTRFDRGLMDAIRSAA